MGQFGVFLAHASGAKKQQKFVCMGIEVWLQSEELPLYLSGSLLNRPHSDIFDLNAKHT